jgi:hypothetical protein
LNVNRFAVDEAEVLIEDLYKHGVECAIVFIEITGIKSKSMAKLSNGRFFCALLNTKSKFKESFEEISRKILVLVKLLFQLIINLLQTNITNQFYF